MVVKFFSALRRLTNEKECILPPTATLRDLLIELVERYGEAFADKVYYDNKLDKDIIILVNGRAIEHLNGLDTCLKEAEVIAIFPKLAGG